ncbi:putative fatty acyl-CoA reductase CG5065 [Bacillus rossius redtenbacheri]|uniref:putative fatty acyl-CoA reductase CG5065 n=1 Tax=Bacillus rossius redtenbacheri TaxID=93214 RepID=UPI002FDEAAB8
MNSKEQGSRTSNSPVQEFYNGQSVLVTGATGFVGKIVVEKLLRSCTGIAQIFLLIREKKGQGIDERMASLLDNPVFDKVRHVEGSDGVKLLDKLVAVRGDMGEPGLGLTPEDRQLLCGQATTVFHAAASVRFDEDLETAVKNNVWSTEEMMRLVKDMSNLKAFVYTSTAYSNCIFSEIQEIVYNYRTELSSVYPKPLSLNTNIPISNEFLKRWPNTYTLSKALAEIVVEDNCKEMSAAILRPSIVIGAWEDPLPGWLDSLAGPAMFIAGNLLGLLHLVHIERGVLSDTVPVDCVASAAIAAAWEVSSVRERGMPRVYNLVSGNANPIEWDCFLLLVMDTIRHMPSINARWYTFSLVCHSRVTYTLLDIVMQMVPSLLMDIPGLLLKGQHRHLDRYTKIKSMLSKVGWFGLRQWKFEDGNVIRLLNKMTSNDRQTFNFDLREIEWKSLVQNYVLGVRRYLLKEADETIPQSRKRMYRLFLLHYSLTAVIAIIIAIPVLKIFWKTIVHRLIYLSYSVKLK